MRIVIVCIFIVFCTQNAFAQECKQLRIASGANAWVPISYLNSETQEFEGIAFDLINAISQKLNLPIEVKKVPWKRMLKYLEDGTLDMGVAIYWNQERNKKYLYTEPYFINEIRVYVKKGREFPFYQLDDLIGRKGIVPDGGSFGEEFDSFAKKHALDLYRVQRKEQLAGLVLAERGDYFVQAYLDGVAYLKNYDLQDDIVPLPHPLATTNVHFAISRQSPCKQFLPQINQSIEALKRDGVLERIVRKYIK